MDIATIQVIATIVVTGLLIFLVSKQLNAATCLFVIGIVCLALTSFITDTSVMKKATVGNSFLDLFELARVRFVANLGSSGILIMSTFGYVYYMNHIKASNLLAIYSARPLKHLKSPYIVVAFAFALGAILKLFIPTHSGLTTLAMATLYPILIAVGCKKTTAACVIIWGGAWEWGPGEPVSNFCASVINMPPAEFFMTKQIATASICIVITIVAFLIVSIYQDRKLVDDYGEAVESDPKAFGVPGFYAFLPVLPLALIIIFSKMVIGTITISVVGANLLSFFVAFAINLIVMKDKKNVFNATQKLYDGMGDGFAKTVSLICTANIFTLGLQSLGGIDVLLKSLHGSDLGGWIAVSFAAALTMITGVITGSGVAASMAIAPLVPEVAAAVQIDVAASIIPTCYSAGFGRAVSPVSAAVIIAAGLSGVSVMKIVRRNAIPSIVAFFSAIFVAMLVL